MVVHTDILRTYTGEGEGGAFNPLPQVYGLYALENVDSDVNDSLHT